MVKRDAARLVSAVETIRRTACDELSWSHYRLLMQIEDPLIDACHAGEEKR